MIVFSSSTPLLYFLIVYQYAMNFSGSIPAKRGTDWRTLLSVKGVPCEWLEVEVTEEGFVLWCIVEFHNVYFMIIILNYSLKSEQAINKS